MKYAIDRTYNLLACAASLGESLKSPKDKYSADSFNASTIILIFRSRAPKDIRSVKLKALKVMRALTS